MNIEITTQALLFR